MRIDIVTIFPDYFGPIDAVLAEARPTPGPDAEAAEAEAVPARLVVPAPSGVPFTQELASAYAAESHLVFACARDEGIDSRVVADAQTRIVVDEVSIGDYVLAGGEA